MPKIVDFALPPGGTIVDVAPSNATALDIESAGADYITVDTTGSGSVIIGKTLTLEAGSTHSGDISIEKADPVFTMLNTTATDSHLARDSLIAFKGTQSGGEVSTLGSIRAEHFNGGDDQAGILTIAVNDGNDGDAPTDYLKLTANQAEFNTKLKVKVGSAAEPGYAFYNDPNSGMFGDESDTVGIATAGVARITVNPTGRVLISDGTASGNIGQVQTNADALVIDSTDDTGISICLNGNDPGRLSFIGQDNADVVGLRATASNTTANGLTMITNGADRIHIDSTGKVAVGASSPEHLFHVQDGDAAVVTNNASDATAKSLIFTRSRNATAGSATIVQDNDILGRIDWYGADASSGDTADNKTIAASIYAQIDGTPGHEDMPGSIRFATTGDNAAVLSDRFIIRQNGNVGIGDTEPNYTAVIGGGKSGPIIYNYNSNSSGITSAITAAPNGAAGMIIDHRVGDSLYLMNTTSENIADGRETGIAFFGRTDEASDEYPMMGALRVKHEGTAADQKGYMAFYTNDGTDDRVPTERMRIASDGKLGINCTNSGYQLEVRGASTHSDIIAWSNTGGALAGRLESYDNEAGAVRVYGANKAGTANQTQHVLSSRDGSNGEVSFNKNQHDCDFTTSSENKTQALFVDASADSVSVGGGGCGVALTSGTVSTSGSSTTLTGSSTVFHDDFHVGSAIKVGTVTTTVTAIANATSLTLEDAINTSSTGTTCTRDGGEFFAVKTGDNKSLFSVTATGAIQAGSAAADSSISNNLAIGDSDALNLINQHTSPGGNRNYIFGHSSDNYKLSTGQLNCIMGYASGEDLTTGQKNTVIGCYAGGALSTAQDVTAIGYSAGGGSNGNYTTLIGRDAGISSGHNNVAVGHSAMLAFTGADSVAVGKEALDASASTKSTAVGYQCLTGLESGSMEANSGFGYRAGLGLDTGQQCLFLGAEADTSDVDGNNQIAIGYGAVCDAPNKIMMGNHRNTDMTMDAPPITVKQTSTDGAGISIEHEGSTNNVVEIGEVDDAGRIELKKGSDGTVTHRMRFGGSSFINNTTSYRLGVSTASPNSNFHSAGTNATLITAGGSLITASHDVGTHSTLLYNTSGGAVTATLPAVSGIAGRTYTFKLVTAGNPLTIDGNGGETVDGSANYQTSTAKTAVTVQCDGVGWQIISEYTP